MSSGVSVMFMFESEKVILSYVIVPTLPTVPTLCRLEVVHRKYDQPVPVEYLNCHLSGFDLQAGKNKHFSLP